MERINFRLLRASEVDVRVGTNKAGGKGATLLLYKDARCDMNILDESVGNLGWKREHSRDNANCIVSIYDKEIGEWVGKEDTGTESNTEKAKGLASDSFKRACVNWGIGRELYTAPFIWIPRNVLSESEIKYAKFKCESIGYDENNQIIHLVITKDGKPIYQFGKQEYKQEELTVNDRLQKAITSAMSQLSTDIGSKAKAIEKLGITESQFKEMYASKVEELWELVQGAI